MTLASTDELETGRRRSTPDGDNLLLDFVRTEADGYRAMAGAAGGRVETDDALGLSLTDTGAATPFGNVAHLRVPASPDTAPAIADRLRTFYGAEPAGGPYLVFSPWSSVDLGAHGFVPVGHPPFMVRPPMPDVPAGGDLTVVRVRTPAQLADFERTLAESFPASELLPFGTQPRLLGDGLLDSAWRLVVGYLDGRPVATAAAVAGSRVGAVEMVSTRSEVRGRGHGSAVTAAAAAACPGTPTALVASDSGRGAYAALGYLPVLRFTLWLGLR